MRKKAAPAKSVTPAPAAQQPRATAQPNNGAPPLKSVSVSPDGIRLRAYQKWEAAGRPESDGIYFWLEAESELGQAR